MFKSFLVLFAILFFVHPSVYADVASDRATLQAQLDQIQAQIQENQTKLTATQAQKASFQRDVNLMNAKIRQAQLEIQRRDLQLKQTQSTIQDNQQDINKLDTDIQSGQESVAQIIRNMRELDHKSGAQMMLEGSFSDVFREQDTYSVLQKALQNAYVKMSTNRSNLSTRVSQLEDKKQEQSDLLSIQQAQKKDMQVQQKEKQNLVTQTKGQESAYKKIIADQQKTAAQIQKQLFALANSNKNVTFGDIFTYAKQAGALTGVRPAVILGILAEESNLGQNVGTGNWKTDMNPTRDAPVFQQICSELGLNPDTQPVSKKAWYGWGGAMGPGQFIPSTWVMYTDRITAATGQNPPNPWDPRTATFATALLMKDNGADGGTRDAERLAALRYLAGIKNATNPKYAFYGDQVMSLADKYQAQIDIVTGQ